MARRYYENCFTDITRELKWEKNPFRPGDTVKLKTGTSPIKILRSWDSGLNGEYIKTGHYVDSRKWQDFEYYEETKEEEDMTVKLYEVKIGDDTLFATKLAVNSAGKWVMEEKGTGKIVTADKDSVEEVMPHTIGIQFSNNGKVYQYFAEAGQYSVGDYYVDGEFKTVHVHSVDTKSKSATKDFVAVGKLSVVT